MSRLSRVWSQAYRSFIVTKSNEFRLLDVTLWPFVLFMSTLLFAHFVTTEMAIIGMLVLGALGWRVLYHFQMEPVQGIMDEYWDNSLEHLMISPISIWEMLFGGTISALIRSVAVGLMFLLLGKLLFGFAVTAWGMFWMGIAAVVICGMILALFSMGVAFLRGSDSFGFIFAFTDVIAVASGVFYPTDVFPEWLRLAVQIFPTTHAFDMLKETVGMAEASIPLFLITSACWLLASILFIRWAFRKARREGKLVRMK